MVWVTMRIMLYFIGHYWTNNLQCIFQVIDFIFKLHRNEPWCTKVLVIRNQ